MHVGLNLIYLVPGETGGMETYGADPRLLAARPDVRFTAFLNRAGALGGKKGPWCELGRSPSSCPWMRESDPNGCAASSNSCPGWRSAPA